LNLAAESRAKKTFNELEGALLRLAERARARAKELKKVIS
jgi:hypothetical protein